MVTSKNIVTQWSIILLVLLSFLMSVASLAIVVVNLFIPLTVNINKSSNDLDSTTTLSETFSSFPTTTTTTVTTEATTNGNFSPTISNKDNQAEFLQNELKELNQTFNEAITMFHEMDRRLTNVKEVDNIPQLLDQLNDTMTKVRKLQDNYVSPFFCLRSVGVYTEQSFPDDRLIASSSESENYSAKNGRLHGDSCWIPSSLDRDPYIQISLGGPMRLTGISTQGMQGNISTYTTQYRIQYFSSNHNKWVYMTDDYGKIEEFSGNRDGDSVVSNYFFGRVVTKKIRVLPRRWKNKPALRLDFKGCWDVYWN